MRSLFIYLLAGYVKPLMTPHAAACIITEDGKTHFEHHRITTNSPCGCTHLHNLLEPDHTIPSDEHLIVTLRIYNCHHTYGGS